MKIGFNNYNYKFNNPNISSQIKSKSNFALKGNKKALALSMMLLAAANSGFVMAQSKKSLENNKNIVNKFEDNSLGKFGTYYSNLIPEGEDVNEHFECLKEIKDLYKDIQGCEYKNPAVLNGISLNDLKEKVLTPAQKLANGEKFGAKQKTLVFLTFNENADSTNAFRPNVVSTGFTSTEDNISNYNFKFDDSFLGHYDNIIVMQPNNGVSADDALDNLFSKLENSLDKNSKVDIAFIGHGVNKQGVRFSPTKNTEKSTMDLSDFKQVENGGNAFAQSMKNIFVNCIDNGYCPRVIGMGCTTDFMQKAVEDVMPEDYSQFVKVFGTPYATTGNYVIGYNKNVLEMFVKTDSIKNNIGLILDIDDGKYQKTNDVKVESFEINPQTKDNMQIIDNYIKDGTTSGSLSKKSGVTMFYNIRKN